MAAVGWMAVAVVAIVAVGAVLVGARSVPDARRYLKMRRM